jgi:uncharacterized peroxidase-related enzyme
LEVPEEIVEQLSQNYQTVATLTIAEQQMLQFAVKLTQQPYAMTANDVVALRQVGWSDRAILDIDLITAYFNFVNRLASGLGVELETPAPQLKTEPKPEPKPKIEANSNT